MLKIEFLTIFPNLFSSFLEESLVKKSIEKGLLSATVTNIRDFAAPPHHSVDDVPYGGGPGMVMKPEPLAAAIRAAKVRLPKSPIILLSASGRKFNQTAARAFSGSSELILVCGRYEGVDQRIIESLITHEISVGDFIVMGGEIPAMLITEAILRLRPGVLGNEKSSVHESFTVEGAESLEAPQYTRPPEFEGSHVPAVLVSGNHAAIAEWRKNAGQLRTKLNRPDLIKK